MIKKLADITDIDGGFPPFMSVIQTDFYFACGDADGVYCQEIEGEKTLVFSLRGGTSTICRLSENADIDELSSFLKFRQVENILSDFFFDGFGLEKRAVLKAVPHSGNFVNTVVLTPASRLSDYEHVFNLLSKNGSFDVWYPTFSKKVNKSCACGVYIAENSNAVSCAIAPFVCEKNGVIAGVYTDEKHRKKGYATQCVKALLCELVKKNVDNAYLWCEDKNIKFYEDIGFSLWGEIYAKEEK